RQRHAHDRIRDLDFIAVLKLAAAIDDEKARTALERDQGMMPGVAPKIDALATGTRESADPLLDRRLAVSGDDDQERPRLQREERLARERMALEGAQLQRQLPCVGLEDADQRPAAAFGDVDECQIVKALAGP